MNNIVVHIHNYCPKFKEDDHYDFINAEKWNCPYCWKRVLANNPLPELKKIFEKKFQHEFDEIINE